MRPIAVDPFGMVRNSRVAVEMMDSFFFSMMIVLMPIPFFHFGSLGSNKSWLRGEKTDEKQKKRRVGRLL